MSRLQSAFCQRKWMQQQWSLGDAASLACCLEAAAPKAGNVTPSQAFADMDFSDFVVGGLALRPVFDACTEKSVGQLVYEGVAAMRSRLDVNTHLGAILLIAPLAKAFARCTQPSPLVDSHHASARDRDFGITDFCDAVVCELEQLTPDDSALVYAAIRLAKPGGLGQAQEHDVRDSESAPKDLRQAMAKVAEFDAVARQYVNGFVDIFDALLPWLQSGLARGSSILEAIAHIQLRWMAAELDGLIVRKAGREVAQEAQQLAGIALDELLETGERGVRWRALDAFLRADGHKRNPGTTADLIAAALFVEIASHKASH